MADGAKRIGRIALAAAACVAAVAIGARIGRAGDRPVAAPAAQADAAGGEMMAIAAKLEARLREHPDDAQGWRMLGFSYFAAGRYPDAARAYTRQTMLTPNDGGGWSALGEALIFARQGRIDDAAARALTRARGLDAKDARARFYLAERRYLDGDHKGAIDDWIALLKDAPPGATFAGPVRERIEQTAAADGIDLTGRLPAAPAPPPGPDPAQLAAAQGIDPARQEAMAKAMTDRLAARLAENPKDEAGWIRLIRARAVLGDAAGARKAFDEAREALAGDPAALGRIEAAARQAEAR